MSVRIDSCLICDAVRPELNGKLLILDFLGICPNVDIRVPALDQPTAQSPIVVGGDGATVGVAPSLLPTFGYAGRYHVRCFVEGNPAFVGEFRVAQGGGAA